MKLKWSKGKNFVFGKISYDEENTDEYIELLFEKFGKEFFEEVYLEYQKGTTIDVAFKEVLIKHNKLKPLNIKKLQIKKQ
ncbi:hypothetical protein VTU32_01360 [Thermoanaerobacter sp. CM-CNRG TB177]|uniref:hypothetical protein n=1 Tax=unclassified Thermoanaerobacter TaxID=2636821 RepID=UPI001BDE6A21|nr:MULTISPECIES: hypothetical protein [unclassified Thermoanaerobacter]MBT1279564.1 hypothetical protein [Thermoanaerobacter sp. CM-CNRG TB177]UZQ83986.1 hypothetical protein OEI98_001146 [Thermoanaerobacter sp. RKWS2]